MGRLQETIHPSFTPEVLDALRRRQIFTVLDFIRADAQQIAKFSLLTFREVLSVKNFLLKKFSAVPTNGFHYYKTALNNTAIIPTGIKGVDSLLEGGLLTGNIYEICGLPASGKTSFLLTIIKNVIGNTQQHIYILDTKNSISAKKLNSILNESDKVQQSSVLSKAIVQRTYTRHDVLNSLYKIKSDLGNKFNLRLIIIDSLPSILLDSSDLSANNAYLNHLANIIRYISVRHHVAFLITNLISTWNDGDFKDQQVTQDRFMCGKYWFTIPNTRLKMEKMGEEKMCQLSIVNSDTLVHKVNSRAKILFTDGGFL